MANWIKNRYDNFPVWVSENGYAGANDEGTHDQERIGFYSVSCMRAHGRGGFFNRLDKRGLL